MSFLLEKMSYVVVLVLAASIVAVSQDLKHELSIEQCGAVEVVNKYGRVSVAMVKTGFGLIASSSKGVSGPEIKISSSNGRTVIEVVGSSKDKRVDLILNVPERSKLKIETLAGSVDVAGDFASIDVRTDTGTISTDVPTHDLSYHLQWTESRPRYQADFEIAPVKERSAGRFEIRGRRIDEIEIGKSKNESGKPVELHPVSIALLTARGIILLNVPPSELTSDLRERPLTNGAKAIVRSGDSLLMEAIRRAAPKYFSDYSRTLPPLRFEPSFAARAAKTEGPNALLKSALVRVTDVNNRSIAGLTVGDFEILEGGMAREIISVESSEAPFNLVLLLDVSGSVENYVDFIRKAARSFVNTVGKKDRVSIVIFNEDVKVLSAFTTDKGKLSESLDTFDAGGGTAYYDALAFTVADTLRPLKGERTAIVLLTDGDDNRSFLAFDSLTGSIQESGALIYPLYVPSGLIAFAAQNLRTDIDPMRKKYMSLTAKSEGEGEKLAKISGGVYYPITQIGQIQKAYEDIVLQMRSAYTITFRSDATLTGDGRSPRLKVRAKREGAFSNVTSVTESTKK